MTCIQGKLEWALRMTQVSYIFWVIAALIAALAGGHVRLAAR